MPTITAKDVSKLCDTASDAQMRVLKLEKALELVREHLCNRTGCDEQAALAVIREALA